jgi:hypothetical protein
LLLFLQKKKNLLFLKKKKQKNFYFFGHSTREVGFDLAARWIFGNGIRFGAGGGVGGV